jgi:hypothetical protein
MKVVSAAFRALGILGGLVTAAVGITPATDDVGRWTTNPYVSSAIALLGLVVAAALAGTLPRDRLANVAAVLAASLPVGWYADFIGTYDWFTTDGGACGYGPCGTLPEVAKGLFAAYGLLVAGVCGAVFVRDLRQRTYDAPDGA